jgi:hypothetical protein
VVNLERIIETDNFKMRVVKVSEEESDSIIKKLKSIPIIHVDGEEWGLSGFRPLISIKDTGEILIYIKFKTKHDVVIATSDHKEAEAALEKVLPGLELMCKKHNVSMVNIRDELKETAKLVKEELKKPVVRIEID